MIAGVALSLLHDHCEHTWNTVRGLNLYTSKTSAEERPVTNKNSRYCEAGRKEEILEHRPK